MKPTTADLNLLFGMLALQMDFLSRDALIEGMHAWVLTKDKPLGRILVERSVLTEDERILLDSLVAKHLAKHGDNPEKSLASLSPPGSIHKALQRISDPAIHASLAHVGTGCRTDEDPFATESSGPDATMLVGPRFRVVRPLGTGGLGIVSVAIDTELGREVALKEIQDRHADHPDHRARFMMEAEVTGKLEHPGIIPVYGLGHYADGRPYYAMRLIHGESLKDAVERFHRNDGNSLAHNRGLEFRELLGRFIDVCNAIGYAHSRHVLHRDLKPANVMLGPFGETLVLDWGLAKRLGKTERCDESSPESIDVSPAADAYAKTVAGTTVGTPAFMSPEQAAGRIDLLGPACDIYSLGATLYCILAGKAPVSGKDTAEILSKVRRGDISRPRAIAPDVPRPLEAICMKAMALDPRDRYRSPRDLANDVKQWLADEPVSVLHESLASRISRLGRRHRAWVQAVATVLVAISVISIAAVVLINAARQNEQIQKLAALEQKKRADKASDEVREKNVEIERQLAVSYLDRGLSLCDQNDPAQGIHWITRALGHAPTGDKPLQHLIRSNLASWSRAIHPLKAYFKHSPSTRIAAISPDGRSVLTGNDAGSLRVWDNLTGKLRYNLPAQQTEVTTVAFSPDSRMVVTASGDGARP
ncbi:MAG: protein kinase [Isosphaerales bacterium]